VNAGESARNWLVLLFQFPQGAGSQRVKIWRRLQSIGAIAIKNSVYVMPKNDQSQEDFEWLLAELTAGGAEAALLESQFISGMDDEALRELFNRTRDGDYAALAEEIEAAEQALADSEPVGSEGLAAEQQVLARARKRLADIEAIDYFGAARHESAQASLLSFGEHLAAHQTPSLEGDDQMKDSTPTDLKNRVWVTRRNVRVDRLASAWLIRRWIDPEARFKFVNAKGYVPKKGEIRFDMFDAEFTHLGDQCTFEVLAGLAAPEDGALRSVGEIVHDIDLKDGKFGRPETVGIASVLSGLFASLENDVQRIERGSALFEDLYRHFKDASA